jgi:glycosyltransferase involved in cell wall biosynthesis
VTAVAEHPLVTVITPCFNHGRYLDDYFGGLLAQTYEHVELIIFDDGSTDDSWQKICEYVPALERKLTRVVAERHENVGYIQELMLALRQAQGELLCVLESDDYYLPTKLQQNVSFLLENPDAGAVHSDVDFLYPNGIERRHWRRTRGWIPTGDVFLELLPRNFIMTCALCSRMDLFRRYVSLEQYLRRGYRTFDYPWSLDLAKHTLIGYIDEPLARYRVVPGSVSHPHSREDYFRFYRSIYAMKLGYIDDPRVTPALAERIRRDYHQIIYQQGVELGRPADCEKGYRWLRARYPRKYGRAHHRLAVRLVRLRKLWRIAERLGVISLLFRGLWALKQRDERRALQTGLEPFADAGPGSFVRST